MIALSHKYVYHTKGSAMRATILSSKAPMFMRENDPTDTLTYAQRELHNRISA